MKTYLVTTGLLFGLLAVLHTWRVVAEWPHAQGNPGFMWGMIGLTALCAVLAGWAFRLLSNLKQNR